MAALFFGLCGLRTVGAVLLAVGVVLLLVASVEYARAARAPARRAPGASTSR